LDRQLKNEKSKYDSDRELDDDSEGSTKSSGPSEREKEQEREKQKELEAKKQAAAKLQQQELEYKQMQQKVQQMQQENDENFLIDNLINSKQPEYSSKGYPITAPILFRAGIQYESFTPNRNNLLKKIAKAMDTIVSRSDDNIQVLVYWMSNAVVLLNLLQKEFPVSIDTDDVSEKRQEVHIETPDDPLGNDPKRAVSTSTHNSPSDIYQSEFGGFDNPVAQFKIEMTKIAQHAYLSLLKIALHQLAPVLITSMFSSLGKK
jgi:hypothetical protein